MCFGVLQKTLWCLSPALLEPSPARVQHFHIARALVLTCLTCKARIGIFLYLLSPPPLHAPPLVLEQQWIQIVQLRPLPFTLPMSVCIHNSNERMWGQVHGFPKVMGVLTHLDSFKDATRLKNTKKTLKHRFWAEIYQGTPPLSQQRGLNAAIVHLCGHSSLVMAS